MTMGSESQPFGDRGFAVVEVIVAFVIATLSLAVLWQAMAGAYQGAARVKYVEQTLAMARSQLDAVGGDGFLGIATTTGEYGAGARWTLSTAPVRDHRDQTHDERRAVQPFWIVLEVRNTDQTIMFKLQTARLARLRE